MDNLNQILSIVENGFNGDDLSEMDQSKNDLINYIDIFFIEKEGNHFFSTTLIQKVLIPLLKLINESNPDRFNSRTKHHLKRFITQKKGILIEVRDKIVNQYKLQLIESDYYENLLKEKIKQKNFLIDENFDFGESDVKEKINKSVEKIIEYYTTASQLGDFEKYKQDIFTFTNKIKLKINDLKYELTHKYKDDYEKEMDDRIDLLFQRDIISYHKSRLEELLYHLAENHLVLKDIEKIEDISLTVFGDKNFDKVEELYEELSELIKIEHSKKEFVKKFFNDAESSIKICFSKHNNHHISFTQNDYGYLISFLQKYFIDEYRNDNTLYNSWWANNFKFHNIEKDYIAIGKMRSNAAKDPTRYPKYKNKIDLLNRIFD